MFHYFANYFEYFKITQAKQNQFDQYHSQLFVLLSSCPPSELSNFIFKTNRSTFSFIILAFSTSSESRFSIFSTLYPRIRPSRLVRWSIFVSTIRSIWLIWKPTDQTFRNHWEASSRGFEWGYLNSSLVFSLIPWATVFFFNKEKRVAFGRESEPWFKIASVNFSLGFFRSPWQVRFKIITHTYTHIHMLIEKSLRVSFVYPRFGSFINKTSHRSFT